MPGSLIFKLIDKKPYVVGVQVSEMEGHFFTREIIEMISKVAKKLINKKQEMEFIRMVDIEQL